jgi:hypothetical protein
MNTLQQHALRPIEDGWGQITGAKNILPIRWRTPLSLLTIILVNLLTMFLFAGPILQTLDPAAGILDIGVLTVLLFGLIAGVLAILGSLWLQELLWQPFKVFRKQFQSHFNGLSSWQQCILYFSVFFLLLYAILWGLAMVL